MPSSEAIRRARSEQRTVLTEVESKALLRAAGIACTDTRLARSREEAVSLAAQLGYPVVLKISSQDITHKSDTGGVKLNLAGREALESAYDEVIGAARRNAPQANIEGVTVQPMARPGTEVIIGMTRDPSFGPVLMFGLGGVFVEVLKDVSFGVAPLDREDAEEMIDSLRGARLLAGYRGQPAADREALVRMLLALSAFADGEPEVAEVDLNPVFARPEGAVAADARIILTAQAVRP